MTLFYLTSLHYSLVSQWILYLILIRFISQSVYENLAKTKLCLSQSDKNWIDLCLSIIYAESVLFMLQSVCNDIFQYPQMFYFSYVPL